MKVDKLAWVDIETTGLGHESKLLEVALIITDADLKEEQVYHQVFTMPCGVDLRDVHPDVLNMHSKNGLWRECYKIDCSHPETSIIPDELVDYYGVKTLSKMPLAGSSVHFDRYHLQRSWPALASLFHYRNFDVSTLTKAFKMWSPIKDSYSDLLNSTAKHRALSDIRHSIELATHYKELLERIK
jgi:oligoribonuclease